MNLLSNEKCVNPEVSDEVMDYFETHYDDQSLILVRKIIVERYRRLRAYYRGVPEGYPKNDIMGELNGLAQVYRDISGLRNLNVHMDTIVDVIAMSEEEK